MRAPPLTFTMLAPPTPLAPWKESVAVTVLVSNPPSIVQPTSSITGVMLKSQPR